MIEQPFSDFGRQRRVQILMLARAAARRRRHGRLMVRGGTVVVLFGAAILVSLRTGHDRIVPIGRSSIVQISTPAAKAPSIIIEYVQTDPTITDRLTIRPEPPRWTTIGDPELLQDLAEAGRPAGIVCMNGKTFLLPR